MQKISVLIIVNRLLTVCGVSKHVFHLLSGLKDREDLNIIVLCGGGDAVSKFNKLGLKIITCPYIVHENRSYFGFIRAVFIVYKIVKRNKINIVHSHHHYAANVAQVVKKFSNIITVMTNHGILPKVGILNHFPSDHVIAVNKYVADYLVNEIIYHGLTYKPIRQKVKNKRLKFLAASRITYDKGLDLFFKAINLLPVEYKNRAEFYYAGEGDYLEELKKLESRLNTGIKYLGIINDLQNYLQNIDVFILSTRSEALPISLIEASFSKNLIITSDFFGLRHFFTPGEDGLVFEMNDCISLSEKIKYVIDNFDNLNFMIENFHKKVLFMFNIDKMVLCTVDLYKKILV